MPSTYDLPIREQFAAYYARTPQGASIRNPGGFARSVLDSGDYDAQITAYLEGRPVGLFSPTPEPPLEPKYSRPGEKRPDCRTCFGSGVVHVQVPDYLEGNAGGLRWAVKAGDAGRPERCMHV